MSEETHPKSVNSELPNTYISSLEKVLDNVRSDISKHFSGPNSNEGHCLIESMRELTFLIGEYNGNSYEGLYQKVNSFQNPTNPTNASALIKEGIERAKQIQLYVVQCIKDKGLPQLDHLKSIIHPHLI